MKQIAFIIGYVMFYACMTWGEVGTVTPIGPGFSFGTFSTPYQKIKATRPGATLTINTDSVGSVSKPHFSSYSANVAANKEDKSNKDTDPTLAANSDIKYPSQKAVKGFGDRLNRLKSAGSAFTVYSTATVAGAVVKTIDFTGGQDFPSAATYRAPLAVYVPSSPTGKWAILLHGGGLDYTQFIYAGSPYITKAEALGMYLVVPDGTVTVSPSNPDWMNIPRDGRVNYHLEDAIRYARETYHLDNYKPSLYGMSMGGWRTLLEMTTHSDSYSNFGASAPPVDLIQWDIDNPASILTAAIGGIYPTGNALYDSIWINYSIDQVISQAPLKSKKLWLAFGDSDTVLNYLHHYTPLVAKIPAANLAYNHLVVGGTHRDFGPDYIDELFTHFSDAELVTSQFKELNLYSTNRSLTLGTNPTVSPHLLGSAGFTAFQPWPTLFTGVNTAAQSPTAGSSVTLITDSGSTMLTGNALGAFRFGGANDSAHTTVQPAGVTAYATENWTPTSTASKIQFETTPTGSTTRAPRFTVESDGKLTIGSGGSIVFPDATALSSAFISSGGISGLIQASNGSGGFISHSAVSMSGGVLRARDLVLSNAFPNFVVNDLVTGGGTVCLSAQQGTVLKNMIPSVINDLTTGGTTNALSAEQGKTLATRIPIITASTVPRMNSGATAYEASQITSTTTGVGIGAATTPTNTLQVSDDTIGTRGAVLSVSHAGTQGQLLIFKRSHGTTASPTAVASGDDNGTVSFQSYVGATNGYRTGASMTATITGTPADAAYGPATALYFSTGDGTASLKERMRITSTGNVGVGVTPSQLFQVGSGFKVYSSPRIQLASSAMPQPTEEGLIWKNQHTFYGNQYQVTRSFNMAHDIQTSDTTVGNTTTETTVYTAAQAANYPTAGKTIKIKLLGYLSKTAAATMTIRLKVGSTTILTSTVATSGSPRTNVPLHADFYFTYRTIGASGTCISSAAIDVDNISIDAAATGTTVVDTTASNNITVTVQWSAADAGNTVTFSQGYTETLGALELKNIWYAYHLETLGRRDETA